MPRGQYQRKPKGEPATLGVPAAETASVPSRALSGSLGAGGVETDSSAGAPVPALETWTVLFASHEGGWVHLATTKGKFKRPQQRCDYRGVLVPALCREVEAASEEEAVAKAILSMTPKVSQ